MTAHVMDQLIEKVLQFFAFSLPFALLGGRWGDYVFSAATFFVLFLDILLLLRGRFLKKPLFFFVLFWFWCFLTAVPRYPLSSYGLSLLALGAMALPLCGSIPDTVKGQSVLKALIYGALASFVLAGYEIGVNFGLPPLTDITSIGLWGTEAVQESVYFGIYRVKAGETEPAHYAHYLVFVYAIVDLAERQGHEIQCPRLLKTTLVFFLLATISLSGLILFVGYQAAAFSLQWRKRIMKKIASVWFWSLLPLVAFFAIGVWQLVGGSISEYAAFTFGRLEVAITSIQSGFVSGKSGFVSGSEASRARSATMMFEYWASQDWIHTLVGEGYANYESWLKKAFPYRGKGLESSFARGSVHSVFSVVGISTGTIGLLLYLGFVRTVTLRRRVYLPTAFLALWTLYNLTTGYLITYQLWWPIILGMLIFRIRRKNCHWRKHS